VGLPFGQGFDLGSRQGANVSVSSWLPTVGNPGRQAAALSGRSCACVLVARLPPMIEEAPGSWIVTLPGPDADVTLVVEDSEVVTSPNGRKVTLIKEARFINVVLH
jgi:hypothetical protein